MYISTESSSSTNTAIVLPMMISTTVVSTPPSNSGSVSASSGFTAGPNRDVTGWSPRGAR